MSQIAYPDQDIKQNISFEEFLDNEDLWQIIVWNDDITTFKQVIDACMDLLGHSKARAKKMADTVHLTGKAVVGIRPKDEAVEIVEGFLKRLIQASCEKT